MEEKRVRDISLTSGETIPAAFIRLENEQPGVSTVHGAILEVPTIDFSDTNEEKLVGEVAKAGREWGMFQVVNHGIPNEVISKLQAVGKDFFELPGEEKEVYAKEPDSKSLEGYGTNLQKEMEGKKGWVDHLFHKIWPPSAINYKFWPQNPASYRDANNEYAKHLHGVVDKLFKSLSLGLGLKDDDLKEAAGGDEMVYLLKINYYPPCPRPDLALGVAPHTDMCALTILVPNHVNGLQAFRDGHWYDVNYIPNALVIHIGDQIEIISNGKYKSVLHRSTVHKEKTRMSWPVFLEPPPDFEVRPHPKLLNNDREDDDKPPKYKTTKYSDYVYCKLNKIPQ